MINKRLRKLALKRKIKRLKKRLGTQGGFNQDWELAAELNHWEDVLENEGYPTDRFWL